MAKKKGKDGMTRLPVDYSNVSVGKERVRIGVKINRCDLTLARADALFCNAQLDATLKCDPNSKRDVEGQQTFEGLTLTVAMVAETKKYSVGAAVIGVSLSAPKTAIDIAELSKFAAVKGMMECTRIGDAGEDGEQHDGVE